MKNTVLAGVLAVSLCAVACEAEELKANSGASQSNTPASAQTKHIDLGDTPDQNNARVGVMPPSRSYDENTGFPDTVTSDSDMNLD